MFCNLGDPSKCLDSSLCCLLSNPSRQRVQCVKRQPEHSLKLDTRHYTVVSWHAHQLSQLHHLPLTSWEFRSTLVYLVWLQNLAIKSERAPCRIRAIVVQALGLQPSFLWKGEVHWSRANKWLQWFIIGGPWLRPESPRVVSTVEHGLMFYFSPVCKIMRLYKWNVWFMSCSFNIGTKDAGVNTVY